MVHWSYHDKEALSHRCKHLRRQYNEKGFCWRCNADFDDEDPNLMIGMFLVSTLRAFPNNSRTLFSASIASIVLYVLFLNLNINVLSVALFHFLYCYPKI